jgi:hypothetical protein
MRTLTRINLLVACVSIAPATFAATRYVNVGLSTGANNGTSWTDAYRGADGLATALAAATSGDQIWVAAGTYLPTLGGARTASLQLKSGVECYGGFAGFESSLGQRNIALHPTILSGDLAGNDPSSIFTDNSYHVISGSGASSTAVLDGFTVRGGNADGFGTNEDRGGGILCTSGAGPTIRLTTFTANRCAFGGGAGYLRSCSPTFTDCVFDANSGGSFGGAFDIANNVGAAFDRCRFTNNTAGRAGGVEIFTGTVVRIYNSLFDHNLATGSGGGGAIYMAGSSPLISNCTIVNNVAQAHSTGGILAVNSMPSITNCIVAQNLGQGGVTPQINPTSLNVTYSMVFNYAGTGNVPGPPIFDSCGPYPLRLAPMSAGVDAGNNAGVPPTSNLDLSGAPRRADNPAVPDSGSGSVPVIDMGAFEAAPDCNGNAIADVCDILGGASPDNNANGIPDECECSGGAPSSFYCTAKLNSLGCLPQIGYSGIPSASASSGFTVSCAKLRNNKNGLLFYGVSGQQAAPFQGGTLCVKAPIKRTPSVNSGGTPAPANDCSGRFAIDMNSFAQGLLGGSPLPALKVAGTVVDCQWWGRDPGFTPPNNTTLSNAVEYTVCQ